MEGFQSQLPLRQLWLDALERAEKSSRADAGAAVARAVIASGGGARAEAVAARLLLLVNDFDGALRAIARADAAASTRNERHLVCVARVFAAGMLGDFPAAMVDFERLVDSGEAPLSLLLAAIELAVRVEASATPARWMKLVEGHPSARSDHLLRLAELHHRVGEDEAASTLVRRALDYPDVRYAQRRRAAQLLLSCRACDQAAELFHRQLIAGEGVADAHRGLATIHLWRGEANAAARHAAVAREVDGNDPTSRRVLAAAALLQGRADEARAALDALAALAPGDAETRAWRAEALLRCGQASAALAEARVAGDMSPDHGTYVALRIVEALATLRLNRRPAGDVVVARAVAALCGGEQSARVRRVVRRIFAGPTLSIDRALATASRLLRSAGVRAPAVDHPRAVEAILEDALAKIGGNRTHATPTRVENRTLSPLVIPPPPRSEAKAALHTVRRGGPAEALRRFDLLMERYPDWPQPWFYRAELHMWMDRLDDARRDIEVALAKKRDPEIEHGHWPRIGLAGIHLLQGRPSEALHTIDREARRFNGPPAQPYFAWRGEILRALGRFEQARAALELVCPPGGCRVGSWITLALTCDDMGDRDRPRQILAHVAELAPGLMIEVCGAADQENIRCVLQTPDGISRLTRDETRKLLERALRAMRGNRSASCLTFVDASNRLRVIPPNRFYQFVHRHDELHDLRALLAAAGYLA